MTAVSQQLQTLDREQRSVIAVITVTIVALLLGWSIKASIQNEVRIISQNGISAQVPAGWVAGMGEGNASFSTWNSRNPAQKYLVTIYPASADVTIDTIVIQRNLSRGQQLSNYRVIDKFSGTINGEEVYQVDFAYVELGGRTDIPTVIQGVDYYMDSGDDRIIVVTMEAESNDFEQQLPLFDEFMNTLQIPSVGGSE